DYAVDLADFLISRGATLDACSAARLGRLDARSAIVRSDPRRVHERGGDGKTPLHWAATIETAEFLLESGADINARDVYHESTPLQYLIREHQDVARLLVARGADADIFAAAALGDLARARKLLDADPSCVAMTVSRRSFPMQNPRAGGIIYIWTLGQHKRPHDVAQEFGHGAIRELLMERSSPVLRLAIACEAGDESAIERLQRERPALTKSLPDELLYSIVANAANSKLDVVRWMLRAGWPATAQEPGGVTALHWAAFHGNVEMARELLAHHASTEARDKTYDGRPIDWAQHGSENSWHRATGDYEAMKILLGPSD
ncbi:MAG: ankyrin repeat domain-containing protein, partial [Gemmatimonadaceae bacterium]